jgi:hypothetical protein
MQYLLLTANAAIAFMIVRGNVREETQGSGLSLLLKIALLAAIVVSFAVFGWKFGLVAVAVTYGALAVSRPILQSRSRGMADGTANPSAGGPGRPDEALRLLSEQIAQPGGRAQAEPFEEFVARSARNEPDPYDSLITQALSRPELQQLLKEHGVDREALHSLVNDLRMERAGQWRGGHFVVASAVSLPETLRFLLDGKKRGVDSATQTVALLDYFEFGRALPSYD